MGMPETDLEFVQTEQLVGELMSRSEDCVVAFRPKVSKGSDILHTYKGSLSGLVYILRSIEHKLFTEKNKREEE